MKSPIFRKIAVMTAAFLAAVLLNSTFSCVFSYENDEEIEVIVELSEPRKHDMYFRLTSEKPSCEEIAEECGVEIECIYKNLNGFSAKGTKAEIERLKNTYGVENVYTAQKIKLPAEPIVTEGDVFVPSAETTELDGEGSVVAVIDGGFLVSHVYLNNEITSPKISENDVQALINNDSIKHGMYISEKIPFVYDYYENDTDVSCSGTHGTHVAGIVGGKNDEMHGAAPMCQLLLMKVFDDGGNTEIKFILEAIDNAVSLGADIINLSLGSPCGNSYDSMTMCFENCFAALRNMGITVCVAAGNNAVIGKTYSGKNYPTTDITDYGTIASPAAADSGLAVAALTYSNGKYTVADYSSWGVLPGLMLKPDISALGTYVKSAYNASATSYILSSGTSMATPCVSGSFAAIKTQMAKLHTNLNGAEVEQTYRCAAQSTADILYDSDAVPVSPRAQGAGIINATAAVETPVILYSDHGSTKIDLFDNLQNTVTFDFLAKNIGDESVSYDIKGIATTDDYTKSDGKYYVNGKPRILDGTDFFFDCGNSVTISPGEEKTITVTMVFNEEKINELRSVFTNGLFAEGFIVLDNQDNPEISIPFLGYIGNWSDQCAFDVNCLLEQFNVMCDSEKCTVYNIEDDEKFIALNRGGKSIQITNMAILRNLDYASSAITDLSGTAVGNEINVLKNGAVKSYWDSAQSNLATEKMSAVPLVDFDGNELPEGEYYISVSAVGEYKTGEQTMGPYKIKTVIDSSAPDACAVLAVGDEGSRMAIHAEDNHGIKAIEIDGAVYEVMKLTYGNQITHIAEISGGFTVSDFAGNEKYISVETAECFACKFDDGGNLQWVEITNVPLVDGKPSVDINGNNCKVFVWENMQPI